MGREDPPPPPPPGSFSQCKKLDMPTIVSCAAQRYSFISASLLWDLKDQGFLRKWSILSKQPRVASDHAAGNMHLHVASSRRTKAGERERTGSQALNELFQRRARTNGALMKHEKKGSYIMVKDEY